MSFRPRLVSQLYPSIRRVRKQIFSFFCFCIGMWALLSNKIYTVGKFLSMGWTFKKGKCPLKCPINTSTLLCLKQFEFYPTFTPPLPKLGLPVGFLFQLILQFSDISWTISILYRFASPLLQARSYFFNLLHLYPPAWNVHDGSLLILEDSCQKITSSMGLLLGCFPPSSLLP